MEEDTIPIVCVKVTLSEESTVKVIYTLNSPVLVGCKE
jgi:hypothetical protein